MFGLEFYSEYSDSNVIVIVPIPQVPCGTKYKIHTGPIDSRGDQSLVKMSWYTIATLPLFRGPLL